VASDLFLTDTEARYVTGVLPLVYLAPLPELCSFSLLFRSVVIPVYNESSAQTIIYTNQLFKNDILIRNSYLDFTRLIFSIIKRAKLNFV